MAEDAFTVEFDQANNTNIAFGTTADYAYTLWLAKKKQIADLEYECGLLVDKYHDEMKRARIPAHLRGTFIEDLFDKDKKRSGFARDFFLKQSFSEEFLKKNKPKFSKLSWFGYGRTAALIDLGIGHYLYTIEIPIPENIVKKDDKERLVGDVKFRVDRLHKDKANDFLKEMEAVQMPTYDWKACFDAIEKAVEAEQGKSAVAIGLEISDKAKRMVEERYKKRRNLRSAEKKEV